MSGGADAVIRRTAQCACGAVTVSCSGEPVLVSLCHCSECQRRTGSAFGAAAFFREDCVDIRGETRRYTRNGESGFSVRHRFCPSCGSTVFWYPERKPGIVAVAVGCFADPAFPPPTQSVHEEGMVGWLGLDLA